MTELAMSDANPPARVSLLTLVSFRGEGIIWETPGQFRVSSRQSGCAVKRRWSTAGVYPPGNWFAPPGSNQSSGGGNETAEASGAEGR